MIRELRKADINQVADIWYGYQYKGTLFYPCPILEK